MKIVSFFSGAGGMDLGFILAGHRIIWSNDFDKYAIETYESNINKFMGHKTIYSDIVDYLNCDYEEIDSKIPSSDLIIGGFPCQGFSIANLNRSMNDSRNFLYEQLLKVISIKKPKYFLLENVKGLESMEKGRILNMIIKDLENCGTVNSKYFPNINFNGYKVNYCIVNALDFGVAQNRERIIILGIRNDEFEYSNLRNFIQEPKKSKGLNAEWKKLVIPPTHSKSSVVKSSVNPVEFINSKYNDLQNNNGELKITQYETPKILYKYNNLFDVISDLPNDFSEEVVDHRGSMCKVNIKNTVGNRQTFWDKHAPTIMGRGSGTGGPLIPPHPNGARRLSVRETARIQTFPDNFRFFGPNSAAYRQIGNAVPVLLSYHIALIFNL